MSEARLRDPEYQKTRALMMAERRLKGATVKELAAEFHLHEQTVDDILLWVKNSNLLRTFESQIIEDLMPGAIAAFKKAMENGDSAVATTVFKGLGFLLKPEEKAKAPLADEGDELETYLRKRVGSNATRFLTKPASAGSALPAAGESGVDSGRVLEGQLIAGSTEASPAVGEGGDEGRTSGVEQHLDLPVDEERFAAEHTTS